MTSKYLKTALLCACLSTSLICAAPSYADAANEVPTVSVSGYAEEKVVPDTAYITVGKTAGVRRLAVAAEQKG